MDRESNNAAPRLAVISTIRQSIKLVLERHQQLLKNLGIPILLLALLDFLSVMLFAAHALFAVLLMLLCMLIFVPYASYCHRLIIMRDAPERAGKLAWTERETRFLGWSLAVYFLAASAHLAGGIVWQVLTTLLNDSSLIVWLVLVFTLAVLPGFYLLARLSLVFPATAIGQRPDIQSVWQLSKGNAFALIMIVAIYPLLIAFILELLISRLILAGTGSIAAIVYNLSFYLFTLFIISALSTAFVELNKLAEINEEAPQKAG